jgi:gamma-glutamyltranspeptidase/glutathione hydrolase
MVSFKHRIFCFFLLLSWAAAPLVAQNAAAKPVYNITKEAVGKKAMVVSAHPLATQVGVNILRAGGNAIDAAVAVQFALAVVYPQAGNIGGGGFLVWRDRKGAIAALDYREKAPAAATETMYQDKDGNVLVEKSRSGSSAAGVPGTVDGMWEAHQKYGRLLWKQLVQPAIELAGKGFAITAQEANNLNRERDLFLQYSSAPSAFTTKAKWVPGDYLVQTDLATTLRRVSEQGRDGFYKGITPTLVVHEMQQKGGGIMTEADFENYHSVWRTPLSFDYKNHHIVTMPPPSSGGVLLQQMLEMAEIKNLASYRVHSPEAMHLMAEIERRAYADRAEYLGDPDFWKVPVRQLTDPAYLKKRMADFNPDRATPSASIKAGVFPESEQTTHYSIVDPEGNAASVTTTLNDSYGSRCVVAGAGFILNNEMDDFSAKPGVPNYYGAVGGAANAIAAHKRPLSSMTPTIITKKGKLWMIVGTPGGTTIPTSVFQVIVNVIDFGLPLSRAVQMSRFHHQWKPDSIAIEAGPDWPIPPASIAALEQKGHTIVKRTAIGRVEAIMRTKNKWQGVADRRGDDTAQGY